jgi:hypothetical protein
MNSKLMRNKKQRKKKLNILLKVLGDELAE